MMRRSLYRRCSAAVRDTAYCFARCLLNVDPHNFTEITQGIVWYNCVALMQTQCVLKWECLCKQVMLRGLAWWLVQSIRG